MAFIVPVVRKDYNLYGKNKNPALSKTGRSNSTPVRIISVENIERNFARQAAARRLRQNSSSSQNSPAASVSQRRASRRVSIRHLNSADSTDSNITTDSRRRVHFGHCEEIEFDSLDSEEERSSVKEKPQQKSSNISSISSIGSIGSIGSISSIGARPRSSSLMNVEPPKQCRPPSKLSTFLKLARLCSPGN